MSVIWKCPPFFDPSDFYNECYKTMKSWQKYACLAADLTAFI